MPQYMDSLIHAEDLERVIRERVSIAEKKQQKFKIEYRRKIAGTDEKYIWIQEQGKITYDESGEIDKIYGTSMDITDREAC